MEAVVRFLPGYAASLVLGFLGGTAYNRYRLWKLRQHAPSAKVTNASVALSQQDYDRLLKKRKIDENANYFIDGRG